MAQGPTFDRNQAERVLGRAAALAVRSGEGDVSLAELEAAAVDAGLDAALVRRAATELALELSEPPREFGMQTRLVRRRVIEHRLDRAQLERLLRRLDTFFGAHGERELSDDGATWFARHMHVAFEPIEGGTLVQISERFVDTAATRATLSLLLSGVAALLTAAISSKALALGAVGLTLFLPLFAVFGFVTLAVARRGHARALRATATEFERALAVLVASASDPAPPPPAGVEPARVPLPAAPGGAAPSGDAP
jgi:hypothetical protein